MAVPGGGGFGKRDGSGNGPQLSPLTIPAQPERGRKAFLKRYWIFGAAIAVVLVAYLVSSLHAAHVDAAGNVTKAGDLGVFKLKKGQCFDEPATDQEISTITAIPCDQAHDAQVTGSITFTETSYDQDALDRDAGQQCATVARQAVSPANQGSSTGVFYFVPDEAAWGRGDRTGTCAVDNAATQLTGSVLK